MRKIQNITNIMKSQHILNSVRPVFITAKQMVYKTVHVTSNCSAKNLCDYGA